jgi:hypothetical protein
MSPRVPPVRHTPTPTPITGKVLAVMLGSLFCAIVLVAAVKGFGAAGHPTLGLIIGIAVLVLSFLLYLRQQLVKRPHGAEQADGSAPPRTGSRD